MFIHCKPMYPLSKDLTWTPETSTICADQCNTELLDSQGRANQKFDINKQNRQTKKHEPEGNKHMKKSGNEIVPKALPEVQTVTIIHREFLTLCKPCLNGENFPVPAGLIIFQHIIKFTPTDTEMQVYKTWRRGSKVHTGYSKVGYAHVAEIINNAKEFGFILNGKSTTVNLEICPELYLKNQEELDRRHTAVIRESILNFFGPRIKDFNMGLGEWKCYKSGLLILDNVLVPLPRKFIPRGWNPRAK